MPGQKFSKLIEKHSDTLAKGAVHKVQTSDRTDAYRSIPVAELERDLHILYEHLSEWLNTKTEVDIHERYTHLGSRRARQDVPIEQLVWGITVAKEHLWGFMLREANADRAFELMNELEFFLSLEQFFDRATYYAIVGHKNAAKERAA